MMEQGGCRAAALGDKSQQDMFRVDTVNFEPPRLLRGDQHNISGARTESIMQRNAPNDNNARDLVLA